MHFMTKRIKTLRLKQKNTDLRIHIQSDTLDDQKYVSVYGIGPVTIQSKNLS